MKLWLLLIPLIPLFLFLLFWFGPNVPAVAQGFYEADLLYSTVSTGRGPIGIEGAEVVNLRRISLASPSSFRLLGITGVGNVEAHVKVFCDGEEVFSTVDKFRMMAVTLVDRKVTIRDLPPGSTCRFSIALACEPFDGVYCKDEPVWGPALTDFEVPG